MLAFRYSAYILHQQALRTVVVCYTDVKLGDVVS